MKEGKKPIGEEQEFELRREVKEFEKVLVKVLGYTYSLIRSKAQFVAAIPFMF